MNKTFQYETVEKMSAVAADYIRGGWKVEAVGPRGCTLVKAGGTITAITMVLTHRAPYNDYNARGGVR